MVGSGACTVGTDACMMMMMTMVGTGACRPPYQCHPQRFNL